jgi:putative photosynthetic complex assembly protein 2
MMLFGWPAAYAVLLWWFTTGVILWLDGRSPSTFRRSMAGATVVLAAAVVLVHESAALGTAAGAYGAFTGAVLIWGWLEMSFLLGFITGPRRHSCAVSCRGSAHFRHAAEAVLYNELALLAGAALVLAVTWAAPNRLALWTYLVLWVMRLSAKLNLFLGVPNLGETFLPPHLAYLRSFFRRRAMNALFPWSVGLSSAGVVLLAERYLHATLPGQRTGYALLTSLLALAVLEHWLMVMPLPSERLWGWAMRRTGRAGSGTATQNATAPPSSSAQATVGVLAASAEAR